MRAVAWSDMRERERKQLLSDIDELRRLLADCSMETIVGACTAYWLKRGSADEVFQDLVSPAKQWSFLLGLMLTLPEPGEPKKFVERTFERAQELLNKIFSAYAWAYFAEPGEAVTEEWVRAREVAMPAFLHYFNQGLLATTDQVEQRIKRYLSPFDDQLLAELGLSASRAVEICRWIAAKLQSSIDALTEAAGREQRARLDLLDRVEREGWDLERLRSEAQHPRYLDLVLELFSGIAQFSYISLAELTEHFGSY